MEFQKVKQHCHQECSRWDSWKTETSVGPKGKLAVMIVTLNRDRACTWIVQNRQKNNAVWTTLCGVTPEQDTGFKGDFSFY